MRVDFRLSDSLSKQRANGMKRAAVVQHLKQMKRVMQDYSPDNICNVDESMVQFRIQDKNKVIHISKPHQNHKRKVRQLGANECGGAHVTGTCAVFANGDSVKVQLVLPKPRCFGEILNNVRACGLNCQAFSVHGRETHWIDNDALLCHAPGGWANESSFMCWLEKCYWPSIVSRGKQNERQILLVDGHSSHFGPFVM